MCCMPLHMPSQTGTSRRKLCVRKFCATQTTCPLLTWHRPPLLRPARYVDQLVAEGKAYPCFCTDEELEAMKKEAEV